MHYTTPRHHLHQPSTGIHFLISFLKLLFPILTTFSFALFANVELTSYHEAIEDDCWRKVIQVKLAALEQNRTWILTELPVGISL